MKDEGGQLYFAARDSHLDALDSTAVEASWVDKRIEQCASKRIILILDCCYAGAYARNTRSAPTTVEFGETLQGRGRIVLTASSSVEFAYEQDGDSVERVTEPSYFTGALVEGLRTGDADRDGDGEISVDELYEYVFENVRARTPKQTPGKSSNVRGSMLFAHSPRGPVEVQLPGPLLESTRSDDVQARFDAVDQLGKLLTDRNSRMSNLAEFHLRSLVNDDSRRVSSAAEAALGPVLQKAFIDEPNNPDAVRPQNRDAGLTISVSAPAAERPERSETIGAVPMVLGAGLVAAIIGGFVGGGLISSSYDEPTLLRFASGRLEPVEPSIVAFSLVAMAVAGAIFFAAGWTHLLPTTRATVAGFAVLAAAFAVIGGLVISGQVADPNNRSTLRLLAASSFALVGIGVSFGLASLFRTRTGTMAAVALPAAMGAAPLTLVVEDTPISAAFILGFGGMAIGAVCAISIERWVKDQLSP